MGTTFSFDKIGAFASPIRRKRKREDDEDFNNSNVADALDLEKPKRKRSKSTSKYIYQTLFLDGEGSDITIVALGKEWHLHKVYLCQCAYFSSMFSGSWTESSLKTVYVSIPDDTIDETALRITFGSLYTDTVFIKPVNVTGVLAAANLFQLEGLIQQCVLMMKEKISGITVCGYYTAAHTYGQEEVEKLCVVWLEDNLLSSQSADLLREISPDLMTALVASHRLFVVQVEMNVYAMLKRWMFLQMDSDWSGDLSDLDKACETLYSNLTEGTTHLLEQSVGVKFIRVFSAIRWQHVICDITSLRIIQQDRILPLEWLRPVIQYHWLNMLQVDQGFDTGPSEVSEAVFEDLCLRCGRVLEHEGQFCWRWTGYNFGFDLVISYTNRFIGIKRNTMKDNCPNAVSLQERRKLYYRLTVLCLDSKGQAKYMQTTGLRHTSLAKDEDQVIMICRKDITFPLHLNLNLMFVTPVPDQAMPKLCPTKPGTGATNTQDVGLQVDPSYLYTGTSSGYLLPRIHPTPNTSPVKLSRETQTPVTETVHWTSGTLQSPSLIRSSVTRKSKSEINTLAESCLTTLHKTSRNTQGKFCATTLTASPGNTLERKSSENILTEPSENTHKKSNVKAITGQCSQTESAADEVENSRHACRSKLASTSQTGSPHDKTSISHSEFAFDKASTSHTESAYDQASSTHSDSCTTRPGKPNTLKIGT